MNAAKERDWFSAADTAKLVRVALKKAFPATKFSVRSDTYAGGASVRIRWVDGPTTKRVDEIARAFNGNSFDGSIDMAYYIDAWVLDGEVIGTMSTGTQGSMGYVAPYGLIPPHDDAKRVHFSCSIDTNRKLSPAFITRLRDAVAAYWGRFSSLPEVVTSDYDGTGYIKATPLQDGEAREIAGDYWDSLIWRAASDRESVLHSNQKGR